MREATGAKPNVYDFPTVCAWYAGVWKTGGAQDHPDKSAYKINTSSGLVEEAQKMKASGFLNYSRAAVRLVPDSYTEDNPQGWWDDAHWQKHGYFTAPYETSAKLGRGMHDAGCLAFTYIQPQIQFPKAGKRISRDFREAHSAWLLNKEVGRNLDCSLPQVQDYVRSRFNALRGNIDGFMVDYYVYDFWNDCLVGKFKGTDMLKQTLRPGEARMLSIRKVEQTPQVLSTNRHLMQGHLDLADVKWDDRRLTGKAKVVAGEPFRIVIALNGSQPLNLQPSGDGRLAVLTLEQATNQTVEGSVNF